MRHLGHNLEHLVAILNKQISQINIFFHEKASSDNNENKKYHLNDYFSSIG